MATSRDDTFRNFTAAQAATYASFRGQAYPAGLYDAVLSYLGPSRSLVYDVGTGPGKVVFDLQSYFQRAIVADVSAAMVERARLDAETKGLAERTRFVQAGAEDCADALGSEERGNVDLLTVAMAVHWFDLPKFYAQAAAALKDGGVMAVWSNSGVYCHPSDPQHAQIQELLDEFNKHPDLARYMTPGNLLNRNRLHGLLLPWQVEETKGSFDESAFERVEWDVDGTPSAPDLPDGTPGPYLLSQTTHVDQIEAGMESASPVTRWRQANPDKVGTDEDIVRRMVIRLRAVLGDRKTIVSGATTTLLLFRKTKNSI